MTPEPKHARPFHLRWTPERDQALRSLVSEKLSSSQIAARLGISRNSAIGRIHRLKLVLAAGAGKHVPKGRATKAATGQPRRAPRRKLIAGIEQIKLSQKPKAAPKPVTPPPAQVPATIPTFRTRDDYFLPLAGNEPVSLIDLQADQCHWPVNGLYGSAPIYCGRDADGPYCTAHRRIAYTPAPPLKEKPRGQNSGTGTQSRVR